MGALRHSRGIRRTSSGVAYNNPTTVNAFSVSAVDQDCIVSLRDGGAAGAIIWTLEADNAASSPSVSFEPPLKFFHNVYMDFVTKGNQSEASIAVVEN